MTDGISDATLDQRLRSVDPLDPGALPSEADTEAALRRLLAAGPPAARTRWRGPARIRVLAGATAAVAALAAGLVILVGSAATSPAFAVTRNPNGTVTVRLVAPEGIAGANQKLASLGVRARILNLVYEARYVASLHVCQGPTSRAVRTLTFDPARIPRRGVLLLAPVREGHVYYFSAVRGGNGVLTTEQTLIARARALSAARTGSAIRRYGPAGKPVVVSRPKLGRHTVQVYCPSRSGPSAH